MSSLYRLLHRNFSTSVESTTTTTTIKELSSDLFRERSFKRLVEKFKKYSEIERFRTRNGIYENTVRRLASGKRFKLIEEILENQKQYKDITKEGFSARLISLYGKSGMYINAQKTFDELPEKNCKRTTLSMNALLAAYLYSKKFDRVHQLFKELPTKLSVEPDLVSYNTVIKAFLEMGSFDSAMSMFEEMEKKGLEPDVITFNTLLNVLYEKGRFSDGEKIWSQMGEKNVTSDIRSYNARLAGLAKEKKMKEAVDFFEKMSTEGVKPDVISFNALINGFVNDGNLEEAKKWYGEISNADYDPDKNTFAIFLPFLCEKGDLNTAFEVCKDIFNSECLVRAALLQSVVDKLVDNSMNTEAKKIVHLGKTNRYRRYKLNLPSGFGPYYKKRMSSLYPKLFSVTSDQFSTVFVSILDGIYKEYDLKRLVKKFKKASELVQFRRRKGIYEYTVCRLASAKQFRSIEEILEDQKKYNDITKESFSARLIMLYGKSGMLKNARKLFEELPDRNCKRSVLSLNALLIACLHCKKFHMVDQLFRELPSKLSIEPNLVSYNTVIKAFCEMGSSDSAIFMLDEMEKKGVIPDLNTFNTLLYGLYGYGRYLDAEKIWSQMSKNNVTPDMRSFRAKLLGLVVENKTKEAVELFEKMRNDGFQPDLFSINTLIKVFVNEGNLAEVKHWYYEIVKIKYAPDNDTFAILLPFLCEKGDLRTAIRVCKDDVFNSRRRVDPALLQLVVDRLVKESMVGKAKKIVERGRSDLHCRYELKLPSGGL